MLEKIYFISSVFVCNYACESAVHILLLGDLFFGIYWIKKSWLCLIYEYDTLYVVILTKLTNLN